MAAVIVKARAFLGTEAALNQIQSVRYVGTVEMPNPAAGPAEPKVARQQIDVIFQSPYRMRMVVTSEKSIQTTVLDGYGAWVRNEDKAHPGAYQIKLPTPDSILQMRANTWENLAFYHNLEEIGGHMEDGGTAELAGHACRRLIFRHSSKIAFTRWFDAVSGQLRLTETDGNTISEEGDLVTGGVRFPKKIITTGKNPDGTATASTITFDQLILNQPAPAGDFEIPILQQPPSPAPALLPLPKAATSSLSPNLVFPTPAVPK